MTSELVSELSTAEEPTRGLDRKLALSAGYQKIETREAANTAYWINPMGKKLRRAPRFTWSPQAAYELAQIVLPNCPVAVKVIPGEKPMAQIEGSAPVQASTIALAICLAVATQLEPGDVAPKKRYEPASQA